MIKWYHRGIHPNPTKLIMVITKPIKIDAIPEKCEIFIGHAYPSGTNRWQLSSLDLLVPFERIWGWADITDLNLPSHAIPARTTIEKLEAEKNENK